MSDDTEARESAFCHVRTGTLLDRQKGATPPALEAFATAIAELLAADTSTWAAEVFDRPTDDPPTLTIVELLIVSKSRTLVAQRDPDDPNTVLLTAAPRHANVAALMARGRDRLESTRAS